MLMLDFSNLNSLWGSLIIEECIRNGCDYFVVSSGSRSTPLTVAVARNLRAKKMICYDERGAAFHALGYARATGKAVVLICTSGTAAANYLPAVIEADVDGVPMLILSADRPPELRETMANQTIVQVGMFANYARWFFDMPVPTEAIAPQMPLTTIDQALYRAHSEAGPVHVNCMFREPLAPVAVEGGISAEYRSKLDNYQHSGTPQTRYYPPQKTYSTHDGSSFYRPTVKAEEHGVIIIGQLRTEAEIIAARDIASQLGWPVLPDITSHFRLGESSTNIIYYFDQVLLHDDDKLYPQTVLHIGGQFVSKRLLQFLEHNRPERYLLIRDSPSRYDPNHLVTHRLDATIQQLDAVVSIWGSSVADSDWLNRWQRRNQAVKAIIAQEMAAADAQQPIVNEGTVARTISKLIWQNHALFVGNSMPIRDVDMFAVADGAAVPVAANRGASGIDGNVASAIGFAVGHERPTTLLLGDLTLLHDLNSLSQLRYVEQPLTIVVINNGGGGIFHLLPIRQFEDVFEENFGTPHQFGFEDAARMFGLAYAQPETGDQFVSAYRNALASGQHSLIEVRTDREANWQAHLDLQTKIREALEWL